MLHGCCTQNILLVILHSQGYANAPTCRHARFHDLWHTCATLLLSRYVNLTIVSEMLGQPSIAIILDTYHSHVLPAMQRSTVSAFEDAL